MMLNLPEKFIKLIIASQGEKGAKWLNDLPEIIKKVEGNWSIKVLQPFPNLSYHFVAPCVPDQDGRAAVLKIGFAEENSPFKGEAAMLKLYQGRGAIKLIRADVEHFALLLEKAEPGTHLINACYGNDAKSVEIAIEILRKIKTKPPKHHNFVHLRDWMRGFDQACGTVFPSKAIIKAKRFYEKLSADECFLLHGDFHHENILSAQREPFLVIDPKGLVGQMGYEISVFLNNHAWWLSADTKLAEKLNQAVLGFSEAFEIEPQFLRQWAYTQGVLAAWWTFEENRENWKPCLASTEVWEV